MVWYVATRNVIPYQRQNISRTKPTLHVGLIVYQVNIYTRFFQEKYHWLPSIAYISTNNHMMKAV